ncbi:MAG TPA: hypothetical protein VF160_10210 [Candidatus Dormibacteraeota bacterium]
MALPEEKVPNHDDDHVRRERLEDGRVALVRIRHRLQKIQDEMELINRRMHDAATRRKSR